MWIPSGIVDPCYILHEVEAPTFPHSFEVGNDMVSHAVLALPRVSHRFAGYFPHFRKPAHTKATYPFMIRPCHRDDSTAIGATNGIGEIDQSARVQITCTNTSSAVISTLDGRFVPWESS